VRTGEYPLAGSVGEARLAADGAVCYSIRLVPHLGRVVLSLEIPEALRIYRELAQYVDQLTGMEARKTRLQRRGTRIVVESREEGERRFVDGDDSMGVADDVPVSCVILDATDGTLN